MRNNSKVDGDEAEMLVMYALHTNSHTVSIPFGDNAAYDLVADGYLCGNHGLQRIQVKKRSIRDNKVTVELHQYKDNDFDILAVVTEENEIHLYNWQGEKSLTFRTSIPKNKQKAGIKMLREYHYWP